MQVVGEYNLTIVDASTFAAGDVVFVTVPIVDANFVETLRCDAFCFAGAMVQNADTDVWTTLPHDGSGGDQWEQGYRNCNACTEWTAEPQNAYQAVRGLQWVLSPPTHLF